jgi:DNA-binding transcriptional ArsR family regulator
MPRLSTFMIETPEQLRAVADPLRQRLMQALSEPKSIKGAALEIGEPVTKLYHHVDQLERAGLIEVVEETRRRSVIERTFMTTAERFSVSPTAFAPGESGWTEREKMARMAVEEALGKAADEVGAFRLMNATARLSQAALEKLEAEVARMVNEFSDPDCPQVDLVMFSSRRK